MVCQSTSEAEFVVANECVKDVLWLRGLLADIGYGSDKPTTIFEDNQTTIAMIKNHLVSGHNHHSCILMAWLREQATKGTVLFKYIRSKQNIADIFTKLLPEKQFVYLRDKLLSTIADDSEEVSTGVGWGCQATYRSITGPLFFNSVLPSCRQLELVTRSRSLCCHLILITRKLCNTPRRVKS